GALMNANLLFELTDPFIRSVVISLEKRPPDLQIDGCCNVVLNGVPCRNPPKRRGLCGSCIFLIEKNGRSIEEFAREVRKRSTHGECVRKTTIVKGICVVIEDGEPCDRPSTTRGLCRPHYRLLEGRQVLPRFVLTDEEIRTLPDLPHWYFDKNVVIDFGRYELFRDPAVVESVALVAAVLQQKALATVSLDCVRAVYTYVGHRLVWPDQEGGLSLSPPEAEARAREYAGRLFFERGGLWHLLPYRRRQFELCATGRSLPTLSLEDALEYHLYAQAKAEHGASLFITADRQLLNACEGVHPRKVLETFDHLRVLLPRGNIHQGR
ncbi:MAG: hypothetical protein HY815_02415, partial [Candidatus Riflebacteria bacterium]|nr:hypothetical protein [Candidatus Riflebacteria bacterium]